EAKDVGGVACTNPPPARCDGEACVPALADLGNATDAKTGRKFFLDYPCDLKPGEKVVFVLNLHGAGSIGNWQRHYFPAVAFKDKVDGFLSLSGGRVGAAPFVARFGPPKADGTPPEPRPAAVSAAMMRDPAPACDYSHIFEVGQYEIDSLPATSPVAERFGCG